MKKRILFICLGNICRSPSAEAIMKYYVKDRGLEEQYYIDSAGISGYHSGDPADRRMKFYPDADFSDFDMIIGMDDQNIRDLQRMATSEEEKNKIFKMTDFCQRFSYRDSVPDPYYGGDSGFELVLDLLEDAVEGLLDQLENE